MKRFGRLITLVAAPIWLLLVLSSLAAHGQDTKPGDGGTGNVIQSIDVSTQAGTVTVRLGLKEALPNPPAAFTVNNPPRVALDFPNTANGLGKSTQDVNQGDLRTIRFGQSGGRTRVVFNLARMLKYDAKVDGNTVVVTLQGAGATAATATTTQFAEPKPGGDQHNVQDIDFRRGKNGEAQIIVDLSDTATGIDLRQQGRTVLVDFLQTMLPPALERRFDVTDFGTQVDFFEVTRQGNNTRITVTPKGRWEQSAYQTDRRFIIEIKPVVEEAGRPKEGKGYAGEKLSLNFQNIEVRAVLQVIADFTNLNIITSDTVTGNLTLRLRDVPWDQALDIILQAKGLDMRKTGNVVWIAPRDELATKEKLALEAQQQIADLEPMRTESFQLNYQKADDFKKILTDATQKILSKRGSAVIDPRTNMLFIQDIPSKLDEIRQLIKVTDIPSRQVLIEARIVEASDTFSRNLGARLGFVDGTARGEQIPGGTHRITAGGGLAATGAFTGQIADTPDFFTDGLSSNMPAPGLGGVAPGQFSLILMNDAMSKFLNLEITALQADGKGKIISSPRVITADNVEAIIEQGTEIPYQQATSSGATSVSFRKATLSLKVKPQITPNDNIIMKLNVNKDSVGANTSAGPSIDTKQISTEVLVESGGTVGIGGIFEQEESSTRTKVPMLGDIPVIGILFRQDLRRNDKRELLIFVTPRVVKDTLTVR
ncbi:MAG TPA: type IV pilus secretin PilQ [Burkholderiales bacterium]|jgi:type IV pilus assembly protein PilQ|nr:type IV pilus secretin PilQ [Burkholderiales bacterium]